MKFINKKVLTLALVLLFSISIVSCDDNSNSDDLSNNVTSSENVSSDTNSDNLNNDNNSYVYEGVPTVSPYKVYNEDNSEYQTFDSMFDAIRTAGENSSSSNKMYIKDGNELLIFKRQNNSNYWCYDGTNYVGSKKESEALEWGQTRKKCYIVNGKGTGYAFIGASYYENSDMSQDIPLEKTSGAYNYMYSKSGVLSGGKWVKQGYGYMECFVRLSEATYTVPTDGSAWNAYIFINGSGGITCDLGLIGVVREPGVLTFALVRNCGHRDHANDEKTYGASFTVLNWNPVTTMTLETKTNVYKGADDLFFQCWQTIDGWILKITNLKTNKVFTINETHKDMFKDCTQYFRFLLAASYCPVTLNVWNARSNASLRNVVFDNINIARYNETNEYDSSSFEEFYPGTDNMIYGFSQGADCASMIYGTHESDGTYNSGNTYTMGQKFLSFSCYYDGGSHYQEYKE